MSRYGHDARCKVFYTLSSPYLVGVVAALGVGGGQYRRPGVEFTDEPGLGHTYTLLLHGLVDGRLVRLAYTVKLVNTADATVRQHQGPGLQLPLTAVLPRAPIYMYISSLWKVCDEQLWLTKN